LIAFFAAMIVGCGKPSDRGEPRYPRDDGANARPSESQDPRFDPAVVREMRGARDKIVGECKKLGAPPWAGVYREGFDRKLPTSTLWVAPKAGVVFQFFGSEAPQPEFTNSGSVEEKDGRLLVKWKYPQWRWWNVWLNDLLVVRWCDRHYLVPAPQILEFCSAIKAGVDPNDWEAGLYCLIREGDLKKPALGPPDLPKGYEKYWKMAAIVGNVTKFKIEKKDEVNLNFRASLTMDVGKADGVLPEMNFKLVGNDKHHRYIFVKTVREHESDAIMACGLETYWDVPIKVGSKLTTLTVSPKK
jgi:hypothetical protein